MPTEATPPTVAAMHASEYGHRVDSVTDSSLGSKIMHLFIWDETFVRWQ